MRAVVLAAVGAALAAGGGAALAAGGGHANAGPRLRGVMRPFAPAFGGPLAAAADYLGLTPAQLRAQLAAGKSLAQIANATNGTSASGLVDALTAVENKRIDAAVSNGKLTQSQASTLAANVKARITALVNGTGRPHAGGIGHRGGFIQAAATYLGLTPQQLFTQLRSGKTLAQVADATSGKSSAGLIDALVAAAKKEIQAAVTGGKLTQSQASAFESNLEHRITAFVNHQPAARPRFGQRPGGWNGAPPLGLGHA